MREQDRHTRESTASTGRAESVCECEQSRNAGRDVPSQSLAHWLSSPEPFALCLSRAPVHPHGTTMYDVAHFPPHSFPAAPRTHLLIPARGVKCALPNETIFVFLKNRAAPLFSPSDWSHFIAASQNSFPDRDFLFRLDRKFWLVFLALSRNGSPGLGL